MKTIYLDHAAATPLDPEVLAEMQPYMREHFGNPGSLHSIGQEAVRAVEQARERIAHVLGCSSQEILFTASGTESINLALQGIARAHKHKGKHIISQKTEHHAVLRTLQALEEEGFDVTYLPVDKTGLVNPEALGSAIRKDTILVTIMYANNEIGTVQPLKEIAQVCQEHDVLLHTDACQAAGMLDLNVKTLGADLLSLDAAKMYGPKGVGLLYTKAGTSLAPILHGGDQEFGKRAGTENVPGIVGFAKALELAEELQRNEVPRLQKRQQHMIAELEQLGATLNGHPTQRLPNNVNMTFSGVEADALVLRASDQGVCITTGSACTSKTMEPSHVLLAIGKSTRESHGSIRLTLGRSTTEDDVRQAIKVLTSILANMKQTKNVFKTRAVASSPTLEVLA